MTAQERLRALDAAVDRRIDALLPEPLRPPAGHRFGTLMAVGVLVSLAALVLLVVAVATGNSPLLPFLLLVIGSMQAFTGLLFAHRDRAAD
jgi:hypothetical protein